VIVPSIGRPSLAATLASMQTEPGDEVLVVGDMGDVPLPPATRFIPSAPGGNWGATERRIGMRAARNPWLALLDDDDVYVPGARALMARAAVRPVPTLFRMMYPNGRQIWDYRQIQIGNVSTAMILIPNDPAKLGRWSDRYYCDFDFLSTMSWSPEEVQWRREVTVLSGIPAGERP